MTSLQDSATPALFLLVMALMANLPWLSTRYWAILPGRTAHKPMPARLLEWLAGALAVWLLGRLLESRDADISPQGPVFALVYGLLFVILSFPGFIYHHFLKPRPPQGQADATRSPDESF